MDCNKENQWNKTKDLRQLNRWNKMYCISDQDDSIISQWNSGLGKQDG